MLRAGSGSLKRKRAKRAIIASRLYLIKAARRTALLAQIPCCAKKRLLGMTSRLGNAAAAENLFCIVTVAVLIVCLAGFFGRDCLAAFSRGVYE
jgi:hypothetical protein